jgi:hypothetical protein
VIVQVFCEELSYATGIDIKPSWCASALSTVASATSTITAMPDTVEQMRDLKFQAAKVGFVKGSMVMPIGTKESAIWIIIEIDTDVVVQQNSLPYTDAKPEIRKLEISEFMSTWRLYKGKVAQPLPGWYPAAGPHQSDAWSAEAVKGAICIAVRSQSMKHQDTAKHLKIFINPFMVMVTKNFKAGSLHIVASSSRVDKTKAGGSIGLGKFDVGGEAKHHYLLKHFVPPIDSKGDLNKSAWVAPFWLVKQVEDPDDANMNVVFTQVQIGNITVQVPSLVNKTDMKVGDELYVLKWEDGSMPCDIKENKRRRAAS